MQASENLVRRYRVNLAVLPVLITTAALLIPLSLDFCIRMTVFGLGREQMQQLLALLLAPPRSEPAPLGRLLLLS